MTTYKVGDRIRLVAPDETTTSHGHNAGLEGVVTAIEPGSIVDNGFDTTTYEVVFEGDHEEDSISLYASEIEPIVDNEVVPDETRVRVITDENISCYKAGQMCTVVEHNGGVVYTLQSDDHSYNQQLYRKDFVVVAEENAAKAVEARMAKVGDRIRVIKVVTHGQYAIGDTGIVRELHKYEDDSPTNHVHVTWEQNEFPKDAREEFLLEKEYEFIDEQGDNAVGKSMQKGKVGDMIKVSTNDSPYTKGDLGRIIALGNVSAEVEWIATESTKTKNGVIHYKDYEVIK